MIAVNALGHQKPVGSYEIFFGLNEPPFSLSPNPRFVYESAAHAAALAQIAYSIERREPLVVITGEIGAGKTLLCRTVIDRIQRKTFLSVVNDPQLDRDDLLKQLLEDFGVISKDRRNLTAASRHELFKTLQNFLVSLVPLQAHAVVVIDEAQHLQPDVLEQIRLLSNIDDARGTLLQIILVGQRDLEPLLSRPELRQFQQRVSRRFRLDPLRGDEVQQYIEHRLAVARGSTQSQLPGGNELAHEVEAWGIGRPAVAFTPEATETIARLTDGLPRVINIICDRALEIAHGLRTRTVDASVIHMAASAVGIPLDKVESFSPAAARRAAAGPVAPDPIAPEGEGSLPLQPGAGGSAEKGVPVAFSALAPAVEPKPSRKWLTIGVPVVVAGALAAWFGVRAVRTPEPVQPRPQPVAPPPDRQSAPVPPPAQSPAAAPAQTPAAARAPSAAAPASESPGRPLAPAAAGPSAPAGEEFEIVAASFRTEARAEAVVAEVGALNLPARRRVADGWQQVILGPFRSRADADAARQRLDDAGLTGAQIVPKTR
jgi:general secretion pathway protein A